MTEAITTDPASWDYPLDPEPWFHPDAFCDKCGARNHTGCGNCIFKPRVGYSQNREDYA